jgi:glycosyltransferase involved in cell wall biosynthesis
MPAEVTASIPNGRPVYINGRFLGRPVTGVERFASEIVRQIDVSADAAPYIVLAPQGVERPAWLKHLGFRNIGRRQGHAWEQTELWWASRDGVLVNLCNSGPVLHGRQLTVLHDALVYRHPENFSKAYGSFHRLLGRLLAYRSSLATVSNFSRRELSSLLHVSADRIGVIYNAVGHVHGITPDMSVIAKFDLGSRPFFLFVGSPASNKNLANALSAFISLGRQDVALVMVGGAASTFARSMLGELPSNVISTGRLTDEQVLALYGDAKALVFPSIYEGFGIPPLEAMSVGCLVMASDIGPVREVCGDTVVYFDPHAPASIAAVMRQVIDGDLNAAALQQSGLARAQKFSWETSARHLVELIQSVDQTNSISVSKASEPHEADRPVCSDKEF